MNLKWTEYFKIRIYDVDFNNKVKLSSIFNFMQEVATSHAANLNVGLDDLLENGLFWVLSRVKLEILQYPTLGEEIKVETWPKGIDKLFALRDFNIYNSDNKVIAKATTAWLIIDSKRLRPKRPKIFSERIPSFPTEHAIIEIPEKIIESPKKESVLHKKIRYTDIDVNNHMNNVKYVEMILDAFSEDVFKTKKIKAMQVNFLSECKFGDEVQVFLGTYDDNSNFSFVEGINKHTNKRGFESTIEWSD